MYRHPQVVTMWEKAQRLITAVFTTLCDVPAQLPRERQARVAEGLPVALVVCDYIAEMSDRKVVREYHRLFDYDVHVLP
jgi:dGTPase